MLENIYSSSFNLKDIDKVAIELMAYSQQMQLWLFYGDLGSGKTTLIKALCKCLGVKNNVSSATYPIINEYLDRSNALIYHCDFYRIKNYREAIDLGTEEILHGDNFCFVEWPSRIENLLPQNNISIHLSYGSENIRKIRALLHLHE